ncbi:MAG TPA: c-type cytochrome domain-containing protein, partial [Planctomycetota bacterium]|nr:c-type cytochrome domain-containing protein [Planctomycetota bacterium]
DCWPDCTRPEPGGCARGGGRFCHSSERRAGGLNLSSYAGIMAGRAGGRQPPLIVPENPEGSFIFWRTDRSNPNFRGPLMPSGATCPLPEPCLETLRLWVLQGAPEK